ncbi:MAG: glycosyltransferase family 2 protein [Chloroflexi bacterium]|nr:glycosyltransferase family 2 protein [Chloroflexota bacterium]
MSISTEVELNAPLASVIIPNWNGIKLLRPCLDSLRKQTLSPIEIIIVDNNSADNSVEVLRTEYPDVVTLALSTNKGYTGGCNAGIYAARGRYLVLLNNDTELDPRWLEELVHCLSLHPEAGIATSRIMLFDQRQTLNAAGDTFGRDGLPDSRGVWQPYSQAYATEGYVFGGSGGAMALRREMLAETGLFDESFFMWCEDVDLSWRCQLLGWKCIYVPDAVIYHHLSATGGGALSSYYVGRNTLWVIARNLPPTLYKRFCKSIWAAQWHIFTASLRSWRGKSARARIRGQFAGLLSMRRWREYNRELMLRRRVTDEYLESILS